MININLNKIKIFFFIILFLGKKFAAEPPLASEINSSNEVFIGSNEMKFFLENLLPDEKDKEISKFVDTLFKHDKFKETRPLLIGLKEEWSKLSEVKENLKIQEQLINVFYILMFSKKIFEKLEIEINNNRNQSTNEMSAGILSHPLESNKSNCRHIIFCLCHFITTNDKLLKADFISKFPSLFDRLLKKFDEDQDFRVALSARFLIPKAEEDKEDPEAERERKLQIEIERFKKMKLLDKQIEERLSLVKLSSQETRFCQLEKEKRKGKKQGENEEKGKEEEKKQREKEKRDKQKEIIQEIIQVFQDSMLRDFIPIINPSVSDTKRTFLITDVTMPNFNDLEKSLFLMIYDLVLAKEKNTKESEKTERMKEIKRKTEQIIEFNNLHGIISEEKQKEAKKILDDKKEREIENQKQTKQIEQERKKNQDDEKRAKEEKASLCEKFSKLKFSNFDHFQKAAEVLWRKINPQEEINTEKIRSSVPSKGAGKGAPPSVPPSVPSKGAGKGAPPSVPPSVPSKGAGKGAPPSVPPSVPSKGAGKGKKPTLGNAETSALQTIKKPPSTTVAMEKENRLSILYLYVEMLMESIKARERLELENFSNESKDNEQKAEEVPKKNEDFDFELNTAKASTELVATTAEPPAIVEPSRIESPEITKVQTESIAINTEEFLTKPTTSAEPPATIETRATTAEPPATIEIDLAKQKVKKSSTETGIQTTEETTKESNPAAMYRQTKSIAINTEEFLTKPTTSAEPPATIETRATTAKPLATIEIDLAKQKVKKSSTETGIQTTEETTKESNPAAMYRQTKSIAINTEEFLTKPTTSAEPPATIETRATTAKPLATIEIDLAKQKVEKSSTERGIQTELTEETTKKPNPAAMYRQTESIGKTSSEIINIQTELINKSQNNAEVQTEPLVPGKTLSETTQEFENSKIQIAEQQPEAISEPKSTLPVKKSQWWIVEFFISSLSIVLNFILDFFYGLFQKIIKNQIFK